MEELAKIIAVFGVIGFTGTAGIMLVRAISRRIAGGVVDPHELQGLRDEVEQLRSEHEYMRTRVEQIDEMQGRLDFAERMLAQVRDKPALPGGS